MIIRQTRHAFNLCIVKCCAAAAFAFIGQHSIQTDEMLQVFVCCSSSVTTTQNAFLQHKSPFAHSHITLITSNNHSHSQVLTAHIWGELGFSILPEDTSTYRLLDRPGRRAGLEKAQGGPAHWEQLRVQCGQEEPSDQ